MNKWKDGDAPMSLRISRDQMNRALHTVAVVGAICACLPAGMLVAWLSAGMPS